MYDKIRISKIIKDIEKEIALINEFGLNERNVNSSEKVYATSMALFAIVNRVIDLAEEIIVKNDWGMPQTYKDYFEVLFSNRVITKSICEDIKKLIKVRNVLAHRYFDVGGKDIIKIKSSIGCVKEFMERIRKIVGRDK